MSKRTGIVAAAFAVLLAALFFLFSASGRASLPALTGVRLDASASSAASMATIRLHAVITPQALTGAGALRYRWSADVGTIVGEGAEVRWIAPADPGKAQVRVEVVDGDAPRRQPVRASRSFQVVDGRDPAGVALAAGRPYEVTSVELDQKSICSTGDVRIKIGATDPMGASDWLLPVIRFPDSPEVRGFDVIGRLSRKVSRREESGPVAVQLQLYDMRSSQTPVLEQTIPLDIASCSEAEQQQHLYVGCDLDLADLKLMCRARHRDDSQPWFKVKRYTWRIIAPGAPDGVDYPDLPVSGPSEAFVYQVPSQTLTADRAVHTWLVEATAELEDGRTMTGRGMASYLDLEFMNQAQVRRLVLRRASGLPYFADGAIQTPFRMRNQFTEPVQFDDIELTYAPCGADEERIPAEMLEGARREGLLEAEPEPGKPAKERKVVVSASSILGLDHLPARSDWHDFVWRVPQEPGYCTVGAVVHGAGTTSGMQVELQLAARVGSAARFLMEAPNILHMRDAARLLSQERGHLVLSATDEETQALVASGKLPPSSVYVAEWQRRFSSFR